MSIEDVSMRELSVGTIDKQFSQPQVPLQQVTDLSSLNTMLQTIAEQNRQTNLNIKVSVHSLGKQIANTKTELVKSQDQNKAELSEQINQGRQGPCQPRSTNVWQANPVWKHGVQIWRHPRLHWSKRSIAYEQPNCAPNPRCQPNSRRDIGVLGTF